MAAPVLRKKPDAHLDARGAVWTTSQTLKSGKRHKDRLQSVAQLFSLPLRLTHYQRRSDAECEFKQACDALATDHKTGAGWRKKLNCSATRRCVGLSNNCTI